MPEDLRHGGAVLRGEEGGSVSSRLLSQGWAGHEEAREQDSDQRPDQRPDLASVPYVSYHRSLFGVTGFNAGVAPGPGLSGSLPGSLTSTGEQ